MCYLKPKTQTPDPFSHISHQEQKKKEWEQLEETHRSWNLVFPVRFELAAAGKLAGKYQSSGGPTRNQEGRGNYEKSTSI